MRRIPLKDRNHKIIAYALVDDEDYDKVIKIGKWYLNGKINSKKYVRCSFHDGERRSSLLLHRFVMNCPKNRIVDHKQGNKLDNRKSQLRICTFTENQRNSRKPITNKSGYKGICWYENRQKWYVSIRAKNKSIYGGQFKKLKEARKKYLELNRKYHGKFGRLH